MWNPFRKKKPKSPEIETVTIAGPLVRANASLRAMETTEPNGRCQILVALSNAKVHYTVVRDRQRQRGESQFTWDDFIRQTEQSLEEFKNDEFASRRLMWFFAAEMILSLEDGNGDPEVEDRLVQVYLLLADASEFMLEVLRHNVLWSDEEKIFFTDKFQANRKATIQLYMPATLKKHPRAKAYAKQHGFWLV